MRTILALMAFSVSAAFAQTPTVTQILNNYSLINAGSVAQGAIFIVKGANLSDQTTGLQSVPLSTTLVGVRMEITVGGTTTFAPMYYALPQQLAGILPSNTPTGNGTLIVRNNGRSSTPAPITVVRSAFGMLTVSGDGSGAARLQDASQGYQELSSTRATTPGNVLVFYGSGVGPVTGDETVAQTQADLASIPVSVTIGGKPATVFYRGRTVFPGLDQINVQVPTLDATSYGCNVAVVITTANVAANATTIPVAASGTTCPPPPSGGGGAVPSPSEINQWISSGNFSYGTINVGRNVSHSAPQVPGGAFTTTTTSSFTAIFGRVSGLAVDLQGFLTPTVGQCTILRVAGSFYPNVSFTYYDAGPSVTGSGPSTAVATRSTTSVPGLGTVISYNAENLPANFGTPGRYTLTGTGGAQVGAFSGALDVGTPIVWTNWEEARTVNRSSGVTVRWTGSTTSQYVSISGSSIDILTSSFTSFTCLANRSAGQFTVPASILTQLAASVSFGGISFPGSMSITGSTNGTRINASGVDFLTANDGTSESVSTTFN